MFFGTILANMYFLYAFLNSVLFSAGLIVSTGLLLLLLALVLPRLREKQSIYFYAIASATLIINGFYGFYNEAHEKLENYLDSASAPNMPEAVAKILIFTGGAMLGVGGFIALRLLLSSRIRKKGGEIHKDHKLHDHSDHIISRRDFNNKREAWIALLLIMLHRGIDGFFFGSVVAKLTDTGKELAPIN